MPLAERHDEWIMILEFSFVGLLVCNLSELNYFFLPSYISFEKSFHLLDSISLTPFIYSFTRPSIY